MIDIAPQLDRHVVLGGLMGAGKSTIAPLLARRLGLPDLDLDADIVARSGRGIEAIFATEGEAGFRAREASALTEALAGPPTVVAGGGGTLCRESAWDAIAAAGGLTVVLEAEAATLAARTADGGRPLLEGGSAEDRRQRLAELAAERAPWYRRADLCLDTTGLAAEAVADLAAERLRRIAAETVPVRLERHGYTISIRDTGLEGLGDAVARRLPPTGSRQVLGLVSDQTVASHHLASATSSLSAAGYRVVPVVFPAGEAHKHLGTVSTVVDGLLEGGLQRGSPVVALGGGVVGDLAGFAASILHRGGPVVQVPTTLLAMVDASIGGKTGVDHVLGKNLIGTFHQPALVHAALGTLETLPERDYRAGLGEVVKYALLEPGGRLLGRLEADAGALLARRPDVLLEVVRTCARHKAEVVRADEREGGARRLLNLGHTLGHALEAHTGYGRWRHGEAVALGLIAAVRVGIGLGRTPAALEARLVRLLADLGLPHDPAPLLEPGVLARVVRDKKMVGDELAFVVPVDGGGAELAGLTLPRLESVLKGRFERGDGR